MSIVGLSILIYIISLQILLKSYKNIERDQITQNVYRARDAISNAVVQLDVKLTDWAWWDDTYNFMTDKNPAYIESNLGVSSIANLKINTMLFITPSGETFFKKLIDFDTKTERSPEYIGQYISSHKVFTLPDAQAKISGIILLPEGPMIMAALPILQSSGEGDPHGTLLFGKFLNTALISGLGDLTHLSMQIYPYDDPSLPVDVALAKPQLTRVDSIVTSVLSTNLIAGYVILRDVYDQPALILKVVTSRDVYTQGLHTFYSFIAISCAAIIAFGITIIILIEVFFISRFSKLSKKVEHIGETKDFSERISGNKRDEFGSLATVINQMLNVLSASREAESKSGKQAIAAEEKLSERLTELEKMNKLMIDRELKMIELKKEVQQLQTSLEADTP